MKLDIGLISNIEVDWNGQPDYPEFSNAFISACDYGDREATEDELDFINDYCIEDLYDEIYDSLI